MMPFLFFIFIFRINIIQIESNFIKKEDVKMTGYVTTDSILEVIEFCERKKKSIKKSFLRRLLKKKELKELDNTISFNFSYLHEFYPKMQTITDSSTFRNLLNAGLLPRKRMSWVKGSPIEEF